MTTKKELRKKVAEYKHAHSAEELTELSENIMCRLEKNTLFQTAQTVLLYNSLPDEVNTHSFIRHWSKHKRILLPVVVNSTDMELRVYTGEDNLQQGAFNILEPQGNRFDDFNEIDLAVIPGVAFDHEGNRLGRGKGYYDRMLKKFKEQGIPTIGVCFDFQKLPAIPVEEHDIPVNEIL